MSLWFWAVIAVLALGFGLGLAHHRRFAAGPPPVPAAPAITASSITGTPEDGQTLTANYTRTGYPAPVMTFQWQNNAANIVGEIAQTIALDAAAMGLVDGDVISCEITATNTEGVDSAEPTIAFVGVAVDAPDAPVLSNLASGRTTGDNPPAWQSTYPNVQGFAGPLPDYSGAGDQVRARWRLDGGAWTVIAWEGLDDELITGDAVLWGFLNDGSLNGGGVFEVQEQIGRDLTLPTETLSAWSNVWSDTLVAKPASAAYVHGDVTGEASADSPMTLTGLTFSTGRAVIFVATTTTALATDAVKLDGVALTKRFRQTEGGDEAFELWDGPVTAGTDHVLQVTYSGPYFGNHVVSYGTVTNGTFNSATGNAPPDEGNPHETPSVTVPANGIAIGAIIGAVDAAATVNAPSTFIDEGRVFFNGGYNGLTIATRLGTGTISFNSVFGTHARIAAVYGAA